MHQTVKERATRVRFRRAVALMVMTLLVPGSAQLLAGNKRVGRIALWTWMAVLSTGLLTLLLSAVWHGAAFYLVSNTILLLVLRLALMASAIGWVLLFMDAWRLGQPLELQQNHRLAIVGINGFLSLTTAAVLLFGAHLVGVQRDFMLTMFGNGEVTDAHAGRFNVLLLGGDAGAGRTGLRPDSMTIASIDAETGRTVLVSLPRNLSNFPFRQGSVMDRQFPDGWTCDTCYLNAVSTWATDRPELFKHPERAGVEATIQAIEGITDLRINYWAMVNLEGFRELVDAVGGVELNVRSRIPVGGLGSDVTGYIEPGVRTLDGHDTLWFARAREGSDDYSRMARQKCVMSAMLRQISPQTALTNFQAIASASSEMVSTNVPAREVDRFMALALEAKSQKISTVSLVPPTIITSNPDIALVRQMIADAITRAEGGTPESDRAQAAPAADSGDTSTAAPAPKPKKQKGPAPVTGGSVGSLSDGYAANQAEDLAASC
ncbi:LCP family protein [Nocardioides bigeumensis]|uniref:Cell envelope-related transcriptional attenuator domain-containing protein n=1 Tax=Nocardioides bigeumensis TaxID=433657 RepID=A0ABN2YFD7_9ACTN